MFRPSLLLAAFALLCASSVGAETPRDIVWKDLLPKAAPLVDPLAQLAVNQRIEIRLIAAARNRQDLGIGDDGDRSKIAERNLTRKLESQGLDVDALLKQFEIYRMRMRARNRMVDPEIDGQQVRLKGHLLPLVESDNAMSDFLLVPYVGACIHVPPPPPNQVVVIRMQSPLKSPGLFETVRVTGHIAVEETTKTLYLVDGAAAVPSAYVMDGAAVELAAD